MMFRMIKYGFTEDEDFIVTDIFVQNPLGGKQYQSSQILKLDMDKKSQ